MLAETRLSPSERMADLAEAPFRTAFQSLRIPVLMVDPHQVHAPVIFANEASLDLTGYPPDEVLGRGWHFLHKLGAGSASLDAINVAMHAGEAFETEFLGCRKDGSSFRCSLSMSPVHDEAGHFRWVTLVLTNVRAEKTAEQDRIEIEEEVGRRTRDLQTALDLKTALLHEVEHRVKNSLQMTTSLVLLKARRLQNPEARKVLQEVAERVSALSAAHRLLSTAGDVSRFNLKEFTTELAGELITALPNGQIDLTLHLQPLSVPASKAAALALLLNEVIGNAVKHAFPKGRRGRLTIELGRAENGVMIAVEDDGVGLDHSPSPEGSFGKTLITMLVHQLKGRLTWHDREPGTRAEIVMPIEAKETQVE
ncbi:sensor histidine kinase [Microvirga sp. VF16]|uniref:sensor histidine kinase n=1 Tax=Microvirga sp. VF16 TaxID=2807101 RepID=UPI00193D504B|nr:histidine kinase dimerization/phosphoacceptor domain -containing protein [Microvirga sp. VF16]QRM30469.1 PAS domain-containing protein [Microvirga sp. VF16]